METRQPQPTIIPTTLLAFSQVQILTILSHAQRTSQQVQAMQALQMQVSLPYTPPTQKYITTPQRVHTTSQYVTKDDMLDVINQL